LPLIDDELNSPAGQTGLTQLVRSVAASPDRWAGLVRYRSVQRWYQHLEQTPEHELWLLSWLPGQRTGFHDHLGSAGAFAVVRGELQEHTVLAAGAWPRNAAGNGAAGNGAAGRTVLERAETGRARVAVAAFKTGEVRAFGPRHVHEVVNGSASPAVSIHAYAPALAGMRRYELTPAGLVLAAIEMAKESW
jgi:predicted metal-dependent enzyme (double-stranded beta helix superfamily)